jgi:hypothetical protein
MTEPRLLSGGNPQIAKGTGDAPVQAWIAAIPGWKSDLSRRLDTLVTATVPGVRKAVKWNTPLYGMDGESWFLGLHGYKNYIQVTFFRGTALTPVPPGASKTRDTRYFKIHEHDPFDETLFASWLTQASQLPGERL